MTARCSRSRRPSIAVDRPRGHRRRLDRLRRPQHRGGAHGARLGDRAGRRTASRTTTTRSLEGQRLERVQFVGVLLLVVIVIGLPLYWVLEPDRQAGAEERLRRAASPAGARAVRDRRPNGGFNCAGCHGGMKATGGVAAVHRHRPGHRRGQGGQLVGAGAEHRALPLQRGRGPLHPHLRPAGLADVGVGPRRRRPDERPADRDADRLPQVDPDPARGLRAEEADDPLTARPATCRPSIQAGRSRRAPASRSRTATYASYGEALFNLDLASGAYSCARCHTPGLELRRPRRAGPGRVRLEPHRRRTQRPLPAAKQDMIDFVKTGLGERQAATARRARAPAACRASATCSPTSRSRPSSNTCGACDA